MSNAIVTAQKGNFDFTFSLVMQFIDICPDAIWRENFGGWPVWQQLYHGFAATNYFVLDAGAQGNAGPCPAGETLSAAADCAAPSKDDMKAYANAIKDSADAWIGKLDDAALAQRHEGASSRMKRDMSNAGIMVLLSGHLLYHLGGCDAALRQHGLKGVF